MFLAATTRGLNTMLSRARALLPYSSMFPNVSAASGVLTEDARIYDQITQEPCPWLHLRALQ
jgi:hypothetical protein